MTTAEVLDNLKETFFEALNDKTSWGRNDLKDLYKDCESDALKKALTEAEGDER